eukprot:gene25259-10258_t
MSWVSHPTPSRLAVLDAAPHGGPGWLVEGTGAAAGGAFPDAALVNWDFADGMLFAGAAFPVWVEVQDARSPPRSVRTASGLIVPRAVAEGCGGGGTLEWRGVRLPQVHYPQSDTAGDLLEWGGDVPVVDGRALLWLRFGAPCERCRVEFTYRPPHGGALSGALSVAPSRTFAVRPLSANAVRFIAPRRVATDERYPIAVAVGAALGMVRALLTDDAAALLVHGRPVPGSGGLGSGGGLTISVLQARHGAATLRGDPARGGNPPRKSCACDAGCEVAVVPAASARAALGADEVIAPYVFTVAAAAVALAAYGGERRTVRAGEPFAVT